MFDLERGPRQTQAILHTSQPTSRPSIKAGAETSAKRSYDIARHSVARETCGSSCCDVGRVDENGDRIPDDTGCSIDIVDFYLAASFRVSKDTGDQSRHSSRIVRDDLRPLLHNATVQPINFRIRREALPLACVQRQDHAFQSLGERPFGFRETTSHLLLITHGFQDEGVEQLGLGAEMPIDRRVRGAHGASDIDNVGLGFTMATHLGACRVENLGSKRIFFVGRRVCGRRSLGLHSSVNTGSTHIMQTNKI
nr:hypothetical protein BDOA9_0101430 [Bradyrhizobium sp. DOA9]